MRLCAIEAVNTDGTGSCRKGGRLKVYVRMSSNLQRGP